MQLSTEDMKRLMTGGASIYQALPGKPSSVEYWTQVYLGACAYLDRGTEKSRQSLRKKELNRPAPIALQNAFDNFIKDSESWDFRELALLCKVYQVEWPAVHLCYSVYHPRQRHHLTDTFLIQNLHILTSMALRHSSAKPFDSQLTKKEFQNLTPLDRKLCCRFRWLTQQSTSWIEWLAECPAKEQFEVLMENIYQTQGPFKEIWQNWGRTKSKKLQALLMVIAWKEPEIQKELARPDWALSAEEMAKLNIEKTSTPWPIPPLLKNLRLTKAETLHAWLPPTYQDPAIIDDLPETHLHSAQLYGDTQKIKEHWPQINFDENGLKLYRSAAKRVDSKFFLEQYEAMARTTSFPPDQIDQVQKWIYAPDVFVPTELSTKIWGLLEKWSDMPEAQETQSFLHQMGQSLTNRLHPSAVSETSFDPFDFFDSGRLTEWEDQMKKRRSLYQTLAKWQKNS